MSRTELQESATVRGRCSAAERGEDWLFPGDRLERFFCGLALMMMFGVSLAHRHTMNPDALAYLELGEAWWRGDWRNAINGYWNPLFPMLLGAAAKFAPSRYWEATALHLANAVSYVFVLLAFRWFLHQVEATFVPESARKESKRLIAVIGYPVFLWASFVLINPAYLTPDVLVFLWVSLAFGFLMKIGRGKQELKSSLLLGLVLALGYWTKTVMFLLGWVFLGSLFLLVKPKKRAAALALAAAAVFVGGASLHIAPLSLIKGRFTYGDSGPLAYAWEVNGYSPYIHWQGEPPESGRPVRHSKRILDYPPTYSWEDPRPVTYSPVYDLSYWNEGMRPQFKIRDQLRRLKSSGEFFLNLMFRSPVALILSFCLVVAVKAAGIGPLRQRAGWFPLLLPCFAPLGLYSIVYIETRYLAPFLVSLSVFCFVPFLSWIGRENFWRKDLVPCLSLAITTVVVCTVLYSIAGEVASPQRHSYVVHQRVADALREAGIKEGDSVAVAGLGPFSFFARLAGTRIVAETTTLPGHPEWEKGPAELRSILESLEQETSAKALVAENLGPEFFLSNGIVVAGTPYTIYPLRNRAE